MYGYNQIVRRKVIYEILVYNCILHKNGGKLHDWFIHYLIR
jgi:hypothetical protein